MSILSNEIRQRLLYRNQNWLCAIVGETGSGKSFCGMRLAEEIQSDFPKDASHIYFSTEEAIHDIRIGAIKKGDVIIIDETGVSFSNRKWYSSENRNFGFLLQVVRHRNFAIIFCLPTLPFMDKTGRTLMHAIINTIGVIRKDKVCVVKWFNAKRNEVTNDTYFKYPVISLPDGRRVRATRVKIHLPSQELIDAYEKKKSAFTQKVTEDAEAEINKSREKKERKPRTSVASMVAKVLDAGEKINYKESRTRFHTSPGYLRNIVNDYKRSRGQ